MIPHDFKLAWENINPLIFVILFCWIDIDHITRGDLLRSLLLFLHLVFLWCLCLLIFHLLHCACHQLRFLSYVVVVLNNHRYTVWTSYNTAVRR